MQYLAFSFILTPGSEDAYDVLAYTLAAVGFDSFEPQGDAMNAYIKAELYDEESLTQALTDFPLPDVKITYQAIAIPATNWNAAWERTWDTPIRIDSHLTIVPAQCEEIHIPDAVTPYVIRLLPHQSFGTGAHPTTQMMLQMAAELPLRGARVLDVGCGTGVLAIYAALLGAAHCVACDIDTWCVESTQQNAALNGVVDRLSIHLGGVETLPVTTQPYGCIFANIHRNILLAQLSYYAEHLAVGGYLLLSGFYEEDASALRHAALALGLEQVSLELTQAWACLVLHRR